MVNVNIAILDFISWRQLWFMPLLITSTVVIRLREVFVIYLDAVLQGLVALTTIFSPAARWSSAILVYF